MDHSSKRTVSAIHGDETRSPATPASLSHPVSPPLKKRRLAEGEPAVGLVPPASNGKSIPPSTASTPPLVSTLRSPFQLTKIRDLPPEMNKDAISLKDILGDPLIAECWEFNYLHDIEFLMSAFDEDVRHLVKVHVVHGFWKKEDAHRLELEEVGSRFPNVKLCNAFMPEMFGTHHTKMMVLFRHDETAQIIIHTANMIVRDWTNMTQAVWVSPNLSLRETSNKDPEPAETTIGSGARFKVDFLNYLRAYDKRKPTCKPLIEQLMKYDFSSIRGSLIGSVPGRHKLNDPSPTRWGWAAMQQALKAVPVSKEKSDIAIQISSIATLGPTDTWLKDTLFRALRGERSTTGNTTTLPQSPNFKVVFPTPDEIRKSLEGYVSGGSIHTKIQSSQQVKQLAYLKPIFHHWANDSTHGVNINSNPTHANNSSHTGSDSTTIQEAGRKRAAPHIKTYIRFVEPSSESTEHRPIIDWALLTSANLSKQAWGEAATAAGEVRIASYELGVLVWPELYQKGAVMQGSFLTDWPGEREEKTVVALRMPYSLPLQKYGDGEVPWVATANHLEPDWRGQVWRHG
ncbi:tyrosyl-DNA phosphodiesterase I [Dichotomopilus funicola]|uniref:Tyrosyl-DNA phosphodiesterase I n=1 Tax=Dichotomopilus funicola TaxID=1934379 RepID=A0AAN6ZKA4_9PEZI|nr:tyrosyl-DNA phosphodiesterase I [Dichotomopilus funicola]